MKPHWLVLCVALTGVLVFPTRLHAQQATPSLLPRPPCLQLQRITRQWQTTLPYVQQALLKMQRQTAILQVQQQKIRSALQARTIQDCLSRLAGGQPVVQPHQAPLAQLPGGQLNLWGPQVIASAGALLPPRSGASGTIRRTGGQVPGPQQHSIDPSGRKSGIANGSPKRTTLASQQRKLAPRPQHRLAADTPSMKVIATKGKVGGGCAKIGGTRTGGWTSTKQPRPQERALVRSPMKAAVPWLVGQPRGVPDLVGDTGQPRWPQLGTGPGGQRPWPQMVLTPNPSTTIYAPRPDPIFNPFQTSTITAFALVRNPGSNISFVSKRIWNGAPRGSQVVLNKNGSNIAYLDFRGGPSSGGLISRRFPGTKPASEAGGPGGPFPERKAAVDTNSKLWGRPNQGQVSQTSILLNQPSFPNTISGKAILVKVTAAGFGLNTALAQPKATPAMKAIAAGAKLLRQVSPAAGLDGLRNEQPYNGVPDLQEAVTLGRVRPTLSEAELQVPSRPQLPPSILVVPLDSKAVEEADPPQLLPTLPSEPVQLAPALPAPPPEQSLAIPQTRQPSHAAPAAAVPSLRSLSMPSLPRADREPG